MAHDVSEEHLRHFEDRGNGTEHSVTIMLLYGEPAIRQWFLTWGAGAPRGVIFSS